MKLFYMVMGFMAGLLPLSAMAAVSGYQRPVPQPQSATAELWFGLATVMLVVSLYIVHRVVKGR
ncbi:MULTISPECIES: hypothetical protein [unclassified Pseudovibrio]|uniref:hypothetical protein n=1 Tax=unclassified Pseudovibrio TaxID=2627060 RepID=UPI0007AE6758|nr:MULTISPECIES: hypothetical protein [unclassified Pseudovibrio]KZL03041.1 hypothetical protein PsW74_00870 [Pseudovibrio sp. W74]KZL04940.1 hypothetical protein PsAD14_05180 [Pseudovibrio sp. Ad14]